MQSAIRRSEGKLNTRLIDIRRSYNKLVSSGILQAGGPKRKREYLSNNSSNAKRKLSFDCTPLETNDIGPPGRECGNNDLTTLEPFEDEEEVVRLLIHEKEEAESKNDGNVSRWCMSKDAIKHYCSREHLDNPPRCQWVSAIDDSGHGGHCGDLRLLQLPMAQGGSTWLITVELGEKLLRAANNHCTREVHVERFEKVRVGSTRGDAGGASTSHGNNERWVYGLRGNRESFDKLFDENADASMGSGSDDNDERPSFYDTFDMDQFIENGVDGYRGYTLHHWLDAVFEDFDVFALSQALIIYTRDESDWHNYDSMIANFEFNNRQYKREFYIDDLEKLALGLRLYNTTTNDPITDENQQEILVISHPDYPLERKLFDEIIEQDPTGELSQYRG